MTAEDLVQDTAVIVFAKAPPMRTADDLYRWSRQVAIRLHIDGIRKDHRIVDLEPPEQADATDIEHVVVQRLRLAAVTEAVKGLSAADRHALMAEAPIGADRREQVRHNVHRHRLRTKLVKLAGPHGVPVLAGPAALARRFVARFARLPRGAVVAAAVLPVALAGVAPVPWLSAGGGSTTASAHTAASASLEPAAPAVVQAGIAAHAPAAATPATVHRVAPHPSPVALARTVIAVQPVASESVSVTKEQIPEDDPRRETLGVCTGAGEVPVIGAYDDVCVRAPAPIPAP
jgi:hypothetical protein